MALKKRKTPKAKLAEDPKVQAVKDLVARGQAAQKAVDEVVRGEAGMDPRSLVHKVPKPSGPSKTQVCDAVRSAAPGLPFAAVDRVAAAVMKLYGRG